MRENRTPSSRWTPEHWMQVSTPRLVLSHVGSAREGRSFLELWAPPLPFRRPLPRPQSRTCSPAVAALAVPGPVLHLLDEQLGEILELPVQPSAPPGPRAAAGLPEEGTAQSFVLAVLQHRHPPVESVPGGVGRVWALGSCPSGSLAPPAPPKLVVGKHSRLTLMFILRLEVVGPVVCGERSCLGHRSPAGLPRAGGAHTQTTGSRRSPRPCGPRLSQLGVGR